MARVFFSQKSWQRLTHQLRFAEKAASQRANRRFAPHVYRREQIITGREVSEGTDQVLAWGICRPYPGDPTQASDNSHKEKSTDEDICYAFISLVISQEHGKQNIIIHCSLNICRLLRSHNPIW